MSDELTPNDVASGDESTRTYGEDALEAAREILEAEKAEIKAGTFERSMRTLGQSVLAGAAVAGFHAYEGGLHDPKAVAWVAAQAAVTVLVTYLHSKVQPAKKK